MNPLVLINARDFQVRKMRLKYYAAKLTISLEGKMISLNPFKCSKRSTIDSFS